jgi:integrase
MFDLDLCSRWGLTIPGRLPRLAGSAAPGLYRWLVVLTGVRRGELCGLQIRDIDLGRCRPVTGPMQVWAGR